MTMIILIVDAIRRNSLTHSDNTENESDVNDWLMKVPGRFTKQKQWKLREIN